MSLSRDREIKLKDLGHQVNVTIPLSIGLGHLVNFEGPWNIGRHQAKF